MTVRALHCFTYRQPRVSCCFRVELHSKGGWVQGRCLNLSENGLLVQLEYPVEAARSMLMRLTGPAWTVELDVTATHMDACHSGLQFQFHSEQQRHFVRAIVRAAT